MKAAAGTLRRAAMPVVSSDERRRLASRHLGTSGVVKAIANGTRAGVNVSHRRGKGPTTTTLPNNGIGHVLVGNAGTKARRVRERGAAARLMSRGPAGLVAPRAFVRPSLAVAPTRLALTCGNGRTVPTSRTFASGAVAPGSPSALVVRVTTR